MKTLEVELPGGAWKAGRLFRRARFYPLNGQVELAILEKGKRDDIPGRVTDILDCALEKIGEEQADCETIADLCVADRQYLMLHLGILLEGDHVWLTRQCLDCGTAFDFSIRRSSLPAKEAGKDFPFAALSLSGSEALFRVPSGADQAAMVVEGEDAVQSFLERCLVSVDGESPPPPGFIVSLSEKEKELIEEALEAVSPALTTGLLARCPECDHEQVVKFDPYAFRTASRESLLRDVHILASTYHWGEQEILALPRERRHHYLRLIDRSRGLYG